MIKKIVGRALELVSITGADRAKVDILVDNIRYDYIAPQVTCSYAASIIDHTTLLFDATKTDIEKLCSEAKEYEFKAVCVNPLWVSLAKKLRKELGASYLIAATANFPLGASSAKAGYEEAKQATKDGADEIDLVASIGFIKSGYFKEAYTAMAQVASTGAYLKVILEMSALSKTEKLDAVLLAFFAGAHMIKTSTGVNGKASPEDVKILRKIAGATLGVKAAGGIRDAETFRAMVEAGANRIGSSGSLKIMEELK